MVTSWTWLRSVTLLPLVAMMVSPRFQYTSLIIAWMYNYIITRESLFFFQIKICHVEILGYDRIMLYANAVLSLSWGLLLRLLV